MYLVYSMMTWYTYNYRMVAQIKIIKTFTSRKLSLCVFTENGEICSQQFSSKQYHVANYSHCAISLVLRTFSYTWKCAPFDLHLLISCASLPLATTLPFSDFHSNGLKLDYTPAIIFFFKLVSLSAEYIYLVVVS